MSIPDLLIWHYFDLLADLSSREIELVKNKVHKFLATPKEAKLKLAKEIVSICHDKKTAEKAEKEFARVFKEKQLPTNIPKIKISQKTLPLLNLLVETKLASSKSEAKRLVLQGGVKIDGVVQDDWKKPIEIKKGQVVQAGKRKFAKII